MSFERNPDPPAVAVLAIGAVEGARGAAAALACACSDAGRAALLVEFEGRAPRPTLLASAAARGLEERLSAHLPAVAVAARGQVCHLAVSADEDGLGAASAAATVARPAASVFALAPAFLQELLGGSGPRLTGVLLRADLGQRRALLALAVQDLRRRELEVAVLKRRLSWIEERRALFGVLGEESGIPDRIRSRLLGRRLARSMAGGEVAHA